MKNILKVAALSLALALVASPTFASSNHGGNDNNNCKPKCVKPCPKPKPHPKPCPCPGDNEQECCPKTEVKNENKADVHNDISTWSNTGKNQIIVRQRQNQPAEDPEIISGDAYAESYAEVQGNENSTELEVALGEVNVENNNDATVHNEISAQANSGENEIRVRGSRAETSIRTGDADSYASAVTMINSNVTRITHSEE